MEHPDYTARARAADAEAEQAKSEEIARGCRELAETYRALARQMERFGGCYPSPWADRARRTQQPNALATETVH